MPTNSQNKFYCVNLLDFLALGTTKLSKNNKELLQLYRII